MNTAADNQSTHCITALGLRRAVHHNLTLAEAFCPVYAALNLLQEKWTLHIIRALLEGPKGFNELSRAVGGVNPATLSQRLDQLVRLGVVEKRVESYLPPRTRYSLTPAGEELEEVVQAIERWARRHLKAPDPAR